MANLTEQQTWATGIYQLETTDPVEGGAEGKSNEQAKQLANRTAWLKKMLDDLVGTLIIWPAATPPAGYLECDGSALSRTTYAALFAVLGTTYGQGAGTTASTTFRLPDLRGEFVRGWDHGRGVDPDRAGRTDRGDGTTGDQVGTFQSDAIRNITGTIYRANHVSAYTGAFYKNVGDWHTDPSSGVRGNFQTGFDASRVVPVGKDNRPRNVALMIAIKY